MITLAKKTLKWVLITILNRKIWLKREEIKDIQYQGDLQRGKDKVKLYQIILADNSIISQCELESDKIYEELIKKDLTKDK